MEAALLVADGMELGVPAAFGDADSMSEAPPFCATSSAVNLDARSVDEQRRWHAFELRDVSKDALPNTACSLAPETVVERLLRAIDVLGTIAPRTAALQCVDNAGEHPPVIDPRHAARILRQKRLNTGLLLIGKPEEIRLSPCLLAGDS